MTIWFLLLAHEAVMHDMTNAVTQVGVTDKLYILLDIPGFS